MEMNHNFRSEAHVAQKSRRDKLRVQQDHSNAAHHGLPVYDAHNLHHLHARDGINLSAPLGNTRYDPSQLCSDMNNFSVSSAQAASLMCKESEKRVILDPSFGNFSGTIPNHGDPQHCNSTWKSIGGLRSASDSNWLANNQQSQIFLGDGSSSSSIRINNSSNTPMDHVSSVHQNMQCDSLPGNQNAFEILAPPSHVRSFGLEVESFKPKNGDDQQAEARQVNWILGPAYTNQSFLQVSSNQWNGDRDHHRLVSIHENYINSSTQALCLTLSSVPSPKVNATHQIADPEASSVVNIPGNISQHNPGPLGPFTGYATILETSMFLRPAQQLLDEICCVGCPKIMETSCEVLSEKIFEESGMSNDAIDQAGEACGSSSKVDGTSSSMGSYRLDNLQKNAKLVYMQEEVCKRYKHYHQQMQLVVSSFESVSALSAATPYISLGLRTVSKHFRNLKNAIANQLKTLKNALGEDYLSSSNAAKGQYSGSSSSMLKFSEYGFQKAKSGGNMGIIENQHVWRPQRGLPEHAVAVLRAWLFDHFLHPYPTDTDKHMLAAQTGLTRNQVSNWFINARVRVWKPMVEEVHMLETKGMSETGHNPDKPNTRSTPDPPRNNNSNQRLNMNSQTTLPNADMWKNQEKRSRTDYNHHVNHNVPVCNFDGSILGNVVPNSHSGIEMGGAGSVSLTLGLRQSAENGQRHHEHHMRPCFEGQIIRDFVG